MVTRGATGSLFGDGPPSDAPLAHRLFFALLPDAGQRQQALRAAHAALGDVRPQRWVRPERYHITLEFLGYYPALAPEVVDAASMAARAVADGVAARPFTLRFEQTANFGSPHNRAYVLRTATVPEPAMVFWRQLRKQLAGVGLGKAALTSFVPHLTVAYGGRQMLPECDIEPFDMPVRDFVLVHGADGQRDYEYLGRWPLGAS